MKFLGQNIWMCSGEAPGEESHGDLKRQWNAVISGIWQCCLIQQVDLQGEGDVLLFPPYSSLFVGTWPNHLIYVPPFLFFFHLSVDDVDRFSHHVLDQYIKYH